MRTNMKVTIKLCKRNNFKVECQSCNKNKELLINVLINKVIIIPVGIPDG